MILQETITIWFEDDVKIVLSILRNICSNACIQNQLILKNKFTMGIVVYRILFHFDIP